MRLRDVITDEIKKGVNERRMVALIGSGTDEPNDYRYIISNINTWMSTKEENVEMINIGGFTARYDAQCEWSKRNESTITFIDNDKRNRFARFFALIPVDIKRIN